MGLLFLLNAQTTKANMMHNLVMCHLLIVYFLNMSVNMC
jgi:hypothetical protein